MALGTWWLGWWAVPVLGAAWGVARYAAFPTATAAVAGGLAWAGLLALGALTGPVGALSRTVGGVLGAPGWVPLLITILFPAALAACSAWLVRGVMPLVEAGHDAGRHEETAEADATAPAPEGTERV